MRLRQRQHPANVGDDFLIQQAMQSHNENVRELAIRYMDMRGGLRVAVKDQSLPESFREAIEFTLKLYAEGFGLRY